MDPRVFLIVGTIMAVVYVGEKVVDGTKVVAHKAKCGIIHVVGKHCKPKNENAPKA